MRATWCLLLIVLTGPSFLLAEDKPKEQMIGGKSELLRFIPKKFASLVKIDLEKRQATVHLEGEKEPTTWPINPDAEFKIHGFWGRLDQFTLGDRVWVWFDLNRQHKPKSILMLADEISQQDVHGVTYELLDVDGKPDQQDINARTITLKSAKGVKKTWTFANTFAFQQGELVGRAGSVDDNGLGVRGRFKAGDKLLIQTAGERLRFVADAAGLEVLRHGQRLKQRETWTKDGLPGTVTFLHPLSGEMELTLDHEAMRWGRNLKRGDKVSIKFGELIKADVKEVRPWRERTVLRLVVEGFDQADLTLGQRVPLKVHVPSLEVDTAELPPDIGRPRTKDERCEWFLASTYCTCAVANEVCTGMFYTLASCNVNACGTPTHVREEVASMIDKGMTDQQIWAELKKNQGPLMVRPHLLP